MEQKLERGEYERPEQFIADVRLIISNCISYNPKESVYAIAAVTVRRSFETSLIKELREDEGV
jgi:Bromodomain